MQATAQLIFVDAAVADRDVLLRDLLPGIDAFVLDPNTSGLSQIASAVADRQDIAAVHIFAHGRPGEVNFSGGPLSLETVEDSQDHLAAIGRALSADGDVRLWVCDAARGDRGKAFVDRLSRTVGAPVLASSGRVGAAEQGGRWELDAGAQPGMLPPLSADAMANYRHVMTVTVDLTSAQGLTQTTLSTAYTEQGTTLIAPLATVSGDGFDSDEIDSLRLVLNGATATESLSLNAVGQSRATVDNVTVSYSSETGTLTLSGVNKNNSIWTYLLSRVQYVNTSDAPRTSGVTIGVTARNGAATNGATTVTMSVTALNDAPLASGGATLAAVDEDAAAPAGATVSSLFAANLSDPDTTSSLIGVAISSYTVDAAKGNWQYSTNGGGSWTTLASAAVTTAIQINATDRLRFVPAANYNGLATALSANLIETGQAAFVSGTTLDLTGATGGLTHISSATVALSETITSVNDAPVASGSATLGAIDQDTGNPPGATVSSLFGGTFSDALDQVSGGSTANTFLGIAISSYTVDEAKGNWQYSTDGGGNWTTLASATSTTAIQLKATDLLRFVPAANYSGLATALSANLIESGQAAFTSGDTIDLTGLTGGTTHISAAAVALSQTVNDTAPPMATIGSDDTALKIGDVAHLTFTLSEVSADFGADDVAVTGGTLSNFAGSGTSYTADFTPDADSTAGATINVAGGGFVDGAGNANLAASELALSIDTVAPTIEVAATVADDNIVNQSEKLSGFDITGTSSGADGETATVTIVDVGDNVIATYMPVIQAGGAWTVTVSPVDALLLADGSYTVMADVSDVAGNPAHAGIRSIVVDTTADGGDQATLAVVDPLISSGDMTSVSVTVAGLDGDATGVLKFTDINGDFRTQAVSANGPSDPTDLTGLADGKVVVSMEIIDTAGNSTEVFASTLNPNPVVNAAPEVVFNLRRYERYILTDELNDPSFTSATLRAKDSILAPLDPTVIASMDTKGVDVMESANGKVSFSLAQFDALGGVLLSAATALTVTGTSGDDIFDFSTQILDPADRVRGSGGEDQLTLAGDYSSRLVFGAETLAEVESIVFGSGQFDIATDDATVKGSRNLLVDGSALAGGDLLLFDGSAETTGTFTFVGGAGSDSFTGGTGADTILAGSGSNTVRYSAASQSMLGSGFGSGYDTVSGFDGAADQFAFTDAVVYDGTIEGKLTKSSFNATIDDALNGLDAGHAALYTATSGNLAGSTFLLANGIGGTGNDIVVRLEGASNITQGSFTTVL
ncbi:MAG: DUF4347 domain-containing protein [Enhydrobacter sp.]|nr:DUF4347 domain-containing protein [Enhydrobacter sp.]